MKGKLYSHEVVFFSASGTHLKRTLTKKQALRIAEELESEGHRPRIMEIKTGRQVYGDITMPKLRKAA
jgi:hypothetical protein